jgi:hypothetical protein
LFYAPHITNGRYKIELWRYVNTEELLQIGSS